MKGALKATTPFPNALLDEAMPRLKDTEWRLLCVIVRQTLGWQDARSQNRKERDWLSREQLKVRTGRNNEALSLGITVLIKKGYITAHNGKGSALSTPSQRRKNHGRIYYGLSDVWRAQITKNDCKGGPSGSSVSVQVIRKSELASALKPNTTKETGTKETVTKRAPYHFRSQTRELIAGKSHGDYGQSDARSDNAEQQPLGKAEPHPLGRGDRGTTGKSLSLISDESAASGTEKSAGFPREALAFKQLFTMNAMERVGHTADIHLSQVDEARLEELIEKHKGLDWKPILEAFFRCDLAHVTRRNFSLASFLDSSNLLLLRNPTTLHLTPVMRSQ